MSSQHMKQLPMLNIRDVRHLCKHLGSTPQEIERICRDPRRYYREGARVIKGKIRHLATPQGRLREILGRLQSLLQRVALPSNIHGGRRGHSHVSNAQCHVGKHALLSMDVKDFFPSVTHRRVYYVIRDRLGCSPDVARYLTRLTTLNGCLPQGSPTSTILSAIVSEKMVRRLDGLARCHAATYTQYVDDIALSGPSHITELTPLVKKVVEQEGFQTNERKTKEAIGKDEKIVTGLRVNQQLDVPSGKMREIRGTLKELEENLRNGKQPIRSDLIALQGKITYVRSFNRGAGRFLMRQLNRIIRDFSRTKCAPIRQSDWCVQAGTRARDGDAHRT